jgi:hypothetical protein
MLNEATLQFVSQHSHDNVRMLALRGCKDDGVDMTAALQQIQGRQTARRKLPSWADTEGIVYPPRLNMEQCSSEATARYKSQIANQKSANRRLLDLTGGFGVDFAFMAEAFDEAVYVERDKALHDIAAHNFRVLGLKGVTTVCGDGLDYMRTVNHATMIFLDPARRDDHGARTYALADCTPDVTPVIGEMLQRADRVMLKLSPMLDWRKAADDLGHNHVEQIHIVAVDNECKELLMVLTQHCEHTLLTCTDIHAGDGQRTEFTVELTADNNGEVLSADNSRRELYLYEPNAAVMKGGCFNELCRAFGVRQIAANSHLFTSDSPVGNFPGRRFRIEAVSTMNKRELKAVLGHLRQANIAVRNFPLTVEQLRRRLKLSDGGNDYIFATTLADGSHVLLLCSNFQNQKSR